MHKTGSAKYLLSKLITFLKRSVSLNFTITLNFGNIIIDAFQMFNSLLQLTNFLR